MDICQILQNGRLLDWCVPVAFKVFRFHFSILLTSLLIKYYFLIDKNKPGFPKPRPPRRKFVSKVLQILNKSTLGTQYPSPSEDKITKLKKEKPIKNKINRHTGVKKNVQINDSVTVSEANTIDSQVEVEGQEISFLSTYLNENINDVETSEQKLIVLQSKKDIIQTPSENSYRDVISDSKIHSEAGLMSLQKKISEIEYYKHRRKSTIEKPVNVKVNSNIVTSINEGLMNSNPTNYIEVNHLPNQESVIKLDSVKTLTQVEKDTKNDSKFYDLFINVLETTFNVYNVNTDYEPTEEEKAKVLEIDAETAEKMNVQVNENDYEYYDTISPTRSQNVFYISNDNNRDVVDIKLSRSPSPSVYESVNPKPTYKKRRTRKTYTDYVKNRNVESKNQPKGKSRDQRRKKYLLNILKEQLSVEDTPEPQNLYEALILMAKNKKKNIRFEDTLSVTNTDVKKCVLRRKPFRKHKGKYRSAT